MIIGSIYKVQNVPHFCSITLKTVMTISYQAEYSLPDYESGINLAVLINIIFAHFGNLKLMHSLSI